MRKHWMSIALAGALICLAAAGCSERGGVDSSEYDLDTYMQPLWAGTQVVNETAMVLRNEDGSLPEIGLLYDIEEVISVRDYSLGTLYEEGRDYTVQGGNLVIAEDGAIAQEIADVTIAAESLWELVRLRLLSMELMKRIHTIYRFVLGFNGSLIALGVAGVLPPSTSATLHNLSTLGISLHSMTSLPCSGIETKPEKRS